MESRIPIPISKDSSKFIPITIIKTQLEFNNNIYTFYLDKIGDLKLKFILVKNGRNCLKYENEYDLNDLHQKNKYFKMFDTLKDLQTDLIEIIKEKNICIKNINNKEIILQLKVISRKDNIINFQLSKVELNEKEKIDIIINDISIIKNEFHKFKNNYIIEYNKLKEELKLKGQKIFELENRINKLETILKSLYILPTEEYTIKIESNIIKDQNEMEFIIKNISEDNNNISLNMLDDSNIEGENETKLFNAYTEKNDIVVLIKTKNNKRFGGYAHESFDKQKFHKNDSKAFLFSLDKMKIYKSNNKGETIWRDDNYKNYLNSINFGGGIDMRIFHKFKSEKNYVTNEFFSFMNDNEEFPLNDTKFFDVLYLEIYQVVFK